MLMLILASRFRRRLRLRHRVACAFRPLVRRRRQLQSPVLLLRLRRDIVRLLWQLVLQRLTRQSRPQRGCSVRPPSPVLVRPARTDTNLLQVLQVRAQHVLRVLLQQLLLKLPVLQVRIHHIHLLLQLLRMLLTLLLLHLLESLPLPRESLQWMQTLLLQQVRLHLLETLLRDMRAAVPRGGVCGSVVGACEAATDQTTEKPLRYFGTLPNVDRAEAVEAAALDPCPRFYRLLV
mmetsp:Transcript_124294/g.357153  ORF Transcript_124294/g.357153 Transcript_124294/m.357153 type:complete len:234 (+) Transcript_124294:366-1067(+)